MSEYRFALLLEVAFDVPKTSLVLDPADRLSVGRELGKTTLTIPQSSWSSPDPWIYENPPVLLSTPWWTCFEADTQIKGKNLSDSLPLNKKVGKVDVEGVIQTGLRGLGRRGKLNDEF